MGLVTPRQTLDYYDQPNWQRTTLSIITASRVAFEDQPVFLQIVGGAAKNMA